MGAKAYSCRNVTEESTQTDGPYTTDHLEVLQTGGEVFFDICGSGVRVYRGLVIEDAKGVGRGLVQYCGAESWASAVQILSATTFPPDANGFSGRMTVMYLFNDGIELRACKKIEFLRWNPANPGPGACS